MSEYSLTMSSLTQYGSFWRQKIPEEAIMLNLLRLLLIAKLCPWLKHVLLLY